MASEIEALLAASGKGGVTEGPGHVELVWGEESPEQSARFEARALPGARFADPESTSVVSVGAADPGSEGAIAEPGGDAAVGASAGSTSWQRRLSPGHRRAVRSFFSQGGARSGSGK